MKAFYAYTEVSQAVVDAVVGAVRLCEKQSLEIVLWPHLTAPGYQLDNLIRHQIADADFLVADITIPNHNVFYEIGYAVALGKPVIPTLNVALYKAAETVQRLGLFDTIGWATYHNSVELSTHLQNWPNLSWSNAFLRRRDYAQPLFILDTMAKTDFRNHIFHTVTNSEVNYRAFDPTEIPRLSAGKAVSEISSSAGVIVTILQNDILDHELNNLRSSFILGLCHDYELDALTLQYGDGPAPFDYREFITNTTHRWETAKHVEQYCATTLVRNQQASARHRRPISGILNQIDLGSPTAENETQQLKYYFVKTAEFSRALRAEGAIVTGRKGAGKSAVYLQVAETLLRERSVCVVDLRPASHNLSEMRQALLDVLSAGVFDHTIAAFWQYIMYMEVLLEIRELALPRSRNDFRLQERIREIEEKFSLDDKTVSGDFTSRLETAVKQVIRLARQIQEPVELRSHLTNILFEKPIRELRKSIQQFSDHYEQLVVLIDDLDKGWPARQVEDHDIIMVKHWIEVLNRMQRDLGRLDIQMKHLLFVRSDIYEKLIELTSDRGKYNLITVDWSDPQQLRHLLEQKVVSNVPADQENSAWEAFNQQVDEQKDVVDRMIEASLRRPRFLIDLSERTLSFAINRGHEVVMGEDVEEGLRQMSLYLVSDFGYEMRDVTGTPEDIFYSFIGAPELCTYEEVEGLLEGKVIALPTDETIEFLLWYGFLGVIGSSNEVVFIYDRAYDFRRLKAELPANQEDALYAINPAFLRGLESS